MATRAVKFRGVHFLARTPDPYYPDIFRTVRKNVSHGQFISTDESGDEENTVYGASEADIARLDSLGALYPEGYDPRTALAAQTEGEAVIADTDFDIYNVSPEEFAKYMGEHDLTVDALLEIVSEDPDLAPLVLQAEAVHTGNEPREGLAEGVQAILASGENSGSQEETQPEGAPAPPEPPTRSDGLPDDAPHISGTKVAWQEYAVSKGLDPGELKRDEIIDMVREHLGE